ncbi:MAG: hypothetical protein Q4A77_06590 [Leptotrichia hongkongensis]|nr:hypothetical protein [Leptotrichia hongkongensis]
MQIGHTTEYDLVSRMSTMSKYPVTVYNPNAVALSTADYFNIPKLHDLLVSPSSSRLYSVVPEMHELD